MITMPTSASAPSRNAMLASTSAVQQMIGASAFTDASPVSMPTFSAPKTSHRAKNFSLTNALIGADGAGTTVRTMAGQDTCVLLDFGRIHSGYPFIELDASGGEVVELVSAEGIPGEWDAKPPASPRTRMSATSRPAVAAEAAK